MESVTSDGRHGHQRGVLRAITGQVAGDQTALRDAVATNPLVDDHVERGKRGIR